MNAISKYACAAIVLAASLTQAAFATPVKYVFDYGASEIGFTYSFNGDEVQGEFPEFTGDLLVDFEDIRKSKVSVNIDASKGKGGFVFATSALRGSKVLDTKRFPTINFVSESAKLSNGKAVVKGQVTVRGVTKPISLKVRFFQLAGQNPADRDDLIMTIEGGLKRHDFGASGYPDLVGDTLNIKIKAKIRKK